MSNDSNQLVTHDDVPRGRPPVPAATKVAFLAALASAKPGTHPFREALKAANISRATVFRLRKDPAFEADFQRALTARVGDVADAIHEEALEGTPILNDEGKEIGRRRNTRLLERLGEQHGLLPSSRTSVAVQVNAPGVPSIASDQLTAEQRARLESLLHGRAGRVIEGEVAPIPCPAPEASPAVLDHEPAHPPEDGSDLV